MLILVSTTIDGQERKKKLSIDDETKISDVRTAVEKLFSNEVSLKGLKRLEWLDPDFKEFVDCDSETVLKDKSVLRAFFNGGGGGSGGSDEKDKIIDQLKNRLQQVEANMRLVNARANTSSETKSQRSAASDLRRIKKEEKCCGVTADKSRSEDSVAQQRRDDAREEKRRQKRQPHSTQEMDKVSCTYCDHMLPLHEINDHEAACVVVNGQVIPVTEGKVTVGSFCSDTKYDGKKNKKNVGFILDVSETNDIAEPSIKRGNRRMSTEGISGGVAPPETYLKRQKLKNKIAVKESFTGLLNQGATCYMNSLLQTLFLSADFREQLLTWEIPEEMRTELNVPYQLQSLFARLRDGKKSAVDTKGLTKSFRWTSSQHFAQHDVQELNRVLFEALQKYIDHLKGNSFLIDYFEGELGDYIKCKTCGARRERVDTFQDITLAVKNTSSVQEALEKFVEAECMEGDNEINCDECSSKQPSLKGLSLKKLPPILTVQLRRFDFDFETLRREKVYDDVDIQEEINLSPFLTDSYNGKYIPSDKRQLFLVAAGCKSITADLLRSVWPFLSHHTYELFSVLAHRGTTSGGHYIAYIRDLSVKGKDREWYNFNDEHVTVADECSLYECLHPHEWQERYDELNPPPIVSRSSTSGSIVVNQEKEKVMSDFFLESNCIIQSLGFANGRTIVTSVNYSSPYYEQSCKLHPGDVIYSVNGKLLTNLKTWNSHKFEPVSITIHLMRNGVKMQVMLSPHDAKHVEVAEIEDILVLESVGSAVLPGDKILSAGGERILTVNDWTAAVNKQETLLQSTLSTRSSFSSTIEISRNEIRMSLPLSSTDQVVSVACDDRGLFIAEVTESNNISQLLQGDKVLLINGNPVTIDTWESQKTNTTQSLNPKHSSDITIGRGHGLCDLSEQQEIIELQYNSKTDIVKSIILRDEKVVITEVLQGENNAINHFAAGDVVVSVDGHPISDFEGWHQAKKTENAILVVAKGAETVQIEQPIQSVIPVLGCAPPPPPPPPPSQNGTKPSSESVMYSPTDGNVNSVLFKNDKLIVSEICSVPETLNNKDTVLLLEGDVIYSADNIIMENIDMWSEIESSQKTGISMIVKRGDGLEELNQHKETLAKQEIISKNGETNIKPEGLDEIVLFAVDYSQIQLNDKCEVEKSTSASLESGDVIKFVNQISIKSDLEFRTLCGSEDTNGGMATVWVNRSKSDKASSPTAPADDDEGSSFFASIFDDLPAVMTPSSTTGIVQGKPVQSRLPTVTSRMYPYMIVYRLRSTCPLEHSSIPTSEGSIPEYLSKLVSSENEEFDQEISDYEAVKDLVEFKAYHNNTMKWCVCLRTDSIWDATVKAAAVFNIPTENATPSTLRIRHYLEASSVPGRSVLLGKEKPSDVPLEEVLGLGPLSAICVETRTEVDPEFKECAAADIKIFCSVYNPSSDTNSEEVGKPSMVIPATSTLQDLVTRVVIITDIPQSELYITIARGSDAHVLFEPNMSSINDLTEEKKIEIQSMLSAQVTNTHDICNLETIYVESAKHACNPEEESKKYGGVEQSCINSVNKIKNTKLCKADYWFPGNDDVEGLLYLPGLTKCSDLKEKIAAAHGIETSSFTMTCLPTKMARKGRSMEEPKKPLQAFVTNKHANVLLTASAASGGVNIDVYFIKQKPGKATWFYTSPGTAVETETEDFKKNICWDCTELKSAGITYSNCRYRKLDTRRQKTDCYLTGTVLSQWLQQSSPIVSGTSTISVVLEQGEIDEELTETSLFLWVQQFFPSERRYGDKKEIILNTDSRLYELVECMTEYTGGEGDPNNVPNERIRIIDKPLSNHFNRETTQAFHCGIQWNSVSQNSSTWMLKKCGYSQNDLVLFCDGSDLERAETDGPTEGNSGGGKRNLQLFLPSLKTTKSTEKGIVIKTEWDNDSPLEEPLTVAGPENKPDDVIYTNYSPAVVWSPEAHSTSCEDDELPQELEKQSRLYDTDLLEYQECSICLETYETEDIVIQLVCDHVLHTKCLCRWYKATGTCPVCKAELRP